MSRYEIAFSGQLMPGAAPEQVKANLTRLFQADAQRIAVLFSGRRILIKSNLDQAGAEKYRSTLERAGAIAEVVAMEPRAEEREPMATPAPVAPPSPTMSAATVAKMIPRDPYMAAFSAVEAPDFGIAPVGVDLQDARPQPQAPQLDLSQLSLAPVGSDMGETPRQTDGPAPDISHLKLQ